MSMWSKRLECSCPWRRPTFPQDFSSGSWGLPKVLQICEYSQSGYYKTRKELSRRWQEGARKDIERAFGVLEYKFKAMHSHSIFAYGRGH
jgi:hypothetical protein